MASILTHTVFGESLKEKVFDLAGDFPSVPINLSGYTREAARGYTLHKAIDDITHGHPYFYAAMKLVKVSSIGVQHIAAETFLDHILAVKWSAYFPDITLDDHAASIYNAIDEFAEELPERMVTVGKLMRKENWLTSFATMEGMEKRLDRLAKVIRERREVGRMDELMIDSIRFLRDDHDRFERVFDSFFPDLQEQVSKL